MSKRPELRLIQGGKPDNKPGSGTFTSVGDALKGHFKALSDATPPGYMGDVFEKLQALDPETLDETTRREIEYMLLSDPAADQFDFNKF